MNTVFHNRDISDRDRLNALYEGQLFSYSVRPSSESLIQYAKDLAETHFEPHHPMTAQNHLSVEEYVAILGKLKPIFINSDTSKRLLQSMLIEFGCDPDKTYFDVPRLRTSTHSNFLTSGLAYAFHAHRDTWFSAPMCQINWWLPVYEIESNNCMALHPAYFDRAIQNGSADFDYDDWVNVGRKNAAQHVNKDTRKQPHAEEELQLEPSLRIVTEPGGVMLFSANHLHSSVPNTSETTRISIDFRTIHIDDVAENRGATNVDCRCTGTTLGDFMRVSDLAHLDESLIKQYC